MLVSRRMYPVLVLALLALSVLTYGCVSADLAVAAGPATVTVRVLDSNDQPLLPLTQVTTTTASVVKDGKSEDSCTGTSAAGALELVTKGNWNGTWFKGLDYLVETIDGLGFPPYKLAAPTNYSWGLWLNNVFSERGACQAELEPGEQVLFLPVCEGTGCPVSPTHLLGIEAPPTAEVGRAVVVTVVSYDAKGERSPLSGAFVEGWGSRAETGVEGHATVIFPAGSTYTLRATGAAGEVPKSVPGEALVCVHNGNDGTCGTQAPSTSPSVKPPPSGGAVNAGPPLVELARIAGVKAGHIYSRRAAPRLLSGSVEVPAGDSLSKVQISLKRRRHGRCYGFDGSRVRFVPIKCDRAALWFSVGAKASFSYLLPARLPAGRYVYEIEAVDGAGHVTKLVPGVSHVVFRVK